MTLMGQCHICGKPSTTACRMCGKVVCEDHADPTSGLCQSCASGKQAGKGRGKGRSTKDLLK